MSPTNAIPIIDFSSFLNGSEQQRQEVAKQIDDAFQSGGFVYLLNHGVRDELVDECFEWVCTHAIHSIL